MRINLIGSEIFKIRTEKGMTQEDIARKCKVSRTYIGMVENGCVVPTNYMVCSILRSLGV